MSRLPTALAQSNVGTWEMGVIHTPRLWAPSRVPWQHDTKVPHWATDPSAWHLLASSGERERQLSLTRTTSRDARTAPVQLLDCELQTQDVIQINYLLFKTMLFRAAHQGPCKHLTHNHSSMWLETRKIKPDFSGILQWKLLFFFSENTDRETSEMLQQGQRGISNCPEDIRYNAQFWQEHNNTQISNKTKPSICNCNDICFAIPSSLSRSPRTTETHRLVGWRSERYLWQHVYYWDQCKEGTAYKKIVI